jgi:hypothetical protein
MLTKFGKLCAVVGALLCATPSFAYDWSVTAHVVVVEGSYMPAQVPFQIDAAAGSCPLGAFFNWNIRGSDATARNINAQAVESLLMTAKSSNQRVTIYGNNSGCTVDFIWLN